MIDKIQIGEVIHDIKDSSVPDEVRNISGENIDKWNSGGVAVSPAEPTEKPSIWVKTKENLYKGEESIEAYNQYRNYLTGVLTNGANYMSVKVEVKPDTEYRWSSSTGTYGGNWCFFDKNMKRISGGQSSSVYTIRTPANVKYLTLPFQMAETWIIIEELITSYDDGLYYLDSQGNYKKVEKYDVTVSGGEPVDKTKIWIQKPKNLFDRSTWVQGDIFNTGHVGGSYSKYMENVRSGFITVKPNTTYTFSVKSNTWKTESYIFINLYKTQEANQNGIIRMLSSGKGVTEYTFTTPENCNYIIIATYNGYVATSFQLEEGPTATEHEPYVNEEKFYVLNGRGLYEEFTGINGKDGEPGPAGYTPVKGTDYWTEEDIASIQTYCTDYINTKIANAIGGEY